MNQPIYKIGNRVRFKSPRCACVGGGFAELEGKIVGVIKATTSSQWYQIDQPTGIVVIKETNILDKLND